MSMVIQYWHQADCPPEIRRRQGEWARAFTGQYQLFDRETAADYLDRQFGAEALAGFLACAVPAMASDYFRYHRLAAEGGLYVDPAFLPGPLAPQLLRSGHPVFALSAPAEDLTPMVRKARTVLGRVLTNRVLHAGPAPARYFVLLAELVRRLVRQRAADRIPMLTGFGVLTAFDYIVSLSEPDPAHVLDVLRNAVPPGSDRALEVIGAFVTDHASELHGVSRCTTGSMAAMAASLFRPGEDQARPAGPAHWSHHDGSIFAPGDPRPLPSRDKQPTEMHSADITRNQLIHQGLFDPVYYLSQCGNGLSTSEAWRHFQSHGDAKGLDPSPYFSTKFYKASYPNWHKKAASAAEDYLLRVAKGQNRQPHPLIDPEDYLEANPDLRDPAQDPVRHFILHGDAEGRSPSKGFDAGFYRRCYLALGQSHPFRHYVTEGSALGFLPRPTPVDAAMSGAAMAAAMTGRARPFVLVCHDAQKAGVPILTLDLARALGTRGYDPVFLLGNAGPLLDRFRAIGPVFILAEGWDATGLASALPQGTAALINTSAAAGLAVPLAQAGLDCLVLLHEMPDYIRDQGLMPDLRLAQAAGARLIASMPQISRGISPLISQGTSRGKAGPPAGDPCPVGQLRPGIIPPPTPLASFRRARLWRQRQDGPVFIGAGHADKRKGFDLFLDAARRIRAAQPGARFVWLGMLDAWARDLANAALAAGLPLTLPGFVEDCLGWYRAADVYLLTSRQDPGPTTAIHAAAVGTPFVGYAADIGLIGMTEGVGRFLPPEDEAGFVAAAGAAANTVTSGSRRDLRRLIRRETGFGPYVTALLSRFHSATDGEA